MFGFVNPVDLIKVKFYFNLIKTKLQIVFFLLINSGKGIYLVRDIESLKSKFAEIDSMDKKKQISIKPMKRIIQRFVNSFY